ncbi:MAG TPA: hypothetical protein VK324_09350, partial [Tepidisphaeraceae bacterium]|nr:hypothetical protein [Tepidisphaeraceae bacterium]
GGGGGGGAAGEPGDNGPGGNANGDAVPQSAADEDDDAPYDSDAPASATVDDTDDRAVGVEALEEDDDGADVEAQDERSSAAPANELPRRSPPPAPLPVVKTGSSDKHLADDEEVAPQPPARRPRSYSDLDAIPDDYD